MKNSCLNSLKYIVIFILFICFFNKGINAQKQNSLRQIYIVDTIQLDAPKLIYIHEKSGSIDKFTAVVVPEIEYRKIDFFKIKSVEQLLMSKNCFIFNDYSSLISTLKFINVNDTLDYKKKLSLTSDNCIEESKIITSCNLKGLNTNRFIIAIMNVDFYNNFKVIEHKKLTPQLGYVLLAYPLD
ncbi:MAG: hypothetical protein CFE21_13660 [Bacteroidetes bacterium B1(2017)]|nr:MAG: hypothetical protein CFE21_13660 [Bacteroidetes bacterium B1(2017)]